MILWSALFMAAIGWAFSGFEEYGFILGGIAGAVFGWGARRVVRAEIRAATAPLQAQLDALGWSASSAPAAPAYLPPPPPPAAAPRESDSAPASDLPAAPVEEPVFTSREPGPVAVALASATAAAKGWLLGGNTIVRVGLVILFVGLSFLARYAASAGLFPIELRLALVATFGFALLATGFRTRVARPGFGLALQGGGTAVLYLTLFAAARLYATLPLGAAFATMMLVCALGCALALLQRSQALAATAFAGGFAVPLLLSDGGGNVAGLFAYLTILNVAILVIAVRRSWRVLNLLGFFATFGIMTLWEAAGPDPADMWVAQAFLIVSVCIYIACALLFARGTAGGAGGPKGAIVDTTLLFGPAIAGFGLEVGLVHDRPFGSAFAALGFGALYLAVAAIAMRDRRAELRVMNEALLAIAVGFVTLAVPLALGAEWTSAAWALEGAGAFWVGMRQGRWVPRLFGTVLQLVAALIYLAATDANVSAVPIANAACVSAILLAIAALATAWWLRKPLSHGGSSLARAYARMELRLGSPAFLTGFAFWWIACAAEICRLVPISGPPAAAAPVFDAATQATLCMLAYVASAWAAQAIGIRLRWQVATWPSLATIAALAIGFVAEHAAGGRVPHLPDAPIWLAAIALHLHALYRNDRAVPDMERTRTVLGAAHAGGVWLGVAIIADGLALGIDRGELWRAAWAEASLLCALLATLAGLTLWAGRALRSRERDRWPLDRHAAAYAWIAAVPLAVLLGLGTLTVALHSSGSADPLPFLPLLNPADLSLALALATLELWRRTVVAAAHALPGASALDQPEAKAGLAALAFVVVNTAWLRIAHHLFGVAWSPDALLDSALVQTGLAILWTLLALALMVVAHRRAVRTAWLVGAGLLGLTVAKLLLVDLNTVGGGARIVAFMGVGVLMLLVGYLAPLPPRAPASREGGAGA